MIINVTVKVATEIEKSLTVSTAIPTDSYRFLQFLFKGTLILLSIKLLMVVATTMYLRERPRRILKNVRALFTCFTCEHNVHSLVFSVASAQIPKESNQ